MIGFTLYLLLAFGAAFAAGYSVAMSRAQRANRKALSAVMGEHRRVLKNLKGGLQDD